MLNITIDPRRRHQRDIIGHNTAVNGARYFNPLRTDGTINDTARPQLERLNVHISNDTTVQR